MALTDNDKLKIRTATKCYLKAKKKASAREIRDYILNLDLNLNSNLTVNILARDLRYCSNATSRNVLADIKSDVDNTNTRVYFLDSK